MKDIKEMTRLEIIAELKKYFVFKELVDPSLAEEYKEFSWNFLRTELLANTLAKRVLIFKVPITVNTYHRGGKFTQRGVRSNLTQEMQKYIKAGKLYMSGHQLGAALDYDVQGYTAEEARKKIIENADLLPYPERLEEDVNWVHSDCYNDGSEAKVKLFHP